MLVMLFYKDENEPDKSNKWTELNDLVNLYRSVKTLSFYSSLDAEHCSWHFVAYYDITELTMYCAAQLISSDLDSASSSATANSPSSGSADAESSAENDDKSYLIIRIPLYVSYLYAGQQAAWTSVDYKSSVEASIIYKTKSLYGTKTDDRGLNLNELLSLNGGFVDSDRTFNAQNLYDATGVDKNDHLVSLTVSKISMTDSGKLVIEFSTIPAFHGKRNNIYS